MGEFSGFFFFFLFSKFVISSFLWSGLSISPTREFVLSLSFFFGCVCVSVFFKRTLDLPLVGAGPRGWIPTWQGWDKGQAHGC